MNLELSVNSFMGPMPEIIQNRVVGVDLSPNHGAFVILDDGELVGYHYVTGVQAIAKLSKSHGTYFSRGKKGQDSQMHEAERRVSWYCYLAVFFEAFAPEYVGIEDYAYRASQNSHQIGEIGGLARMVSWIYNCKLRLHGPESIKLFASHDGAASKEDVQDDCLKRWPETYEFFKYKTERNRTTVEDLFDAFALAQLVWLEVQIRSGDVPLNTLHKKELQVFNRVTKRWTTNLLGRDWIQKEGGWTPFSKS